ncbi:MAG: hypothetical protein NTX51_14305, partial [Verrucomicrobia bacterium]|nr:hypothetical protein [Verrucomicrobiota bacterium]
MPRNRWILVLAAGWLLWACSPVARGASAAQHTVDVWNTDQGDLPHSVVLAMIQTRDGYLWLGTPKGLARFDGVRFERFNESNTPGLGSGVVVKLFEDSRDNLWVGTKSGIVLVTPQGKLTPVDVGRGGELRAACEDAAGAVWLYTADGQLARCRDKRFEVWNVGGSLPSRCRALIAEDASSLWVGTDISLVGIS